jgi:hypothetical protein
MRKRNEMVCTVNTSNRARLERWLEKSSVAELPLNLPWNI